ncbi:MAG: putative TonB-dependent receptor BfrD [Verrucomicrobiae bacterium]|nr:putative TonB-dependent receptor BfrD [Verrucomicrobiae bacterium]
MKREKTKSKVVPQLEPRIGRAGTFTARNCASAATLALVNSIMMAGTVCAQDTNAPAVTAGGTNESARLPDVVVEEKKETYMPERVESPKYTEPVRDIPQTITIVPQTVIQDQGASTLRDVLRNVPGISMQAGEGGGGLPGDNLSIRGFNARTDIYVDGVRDYGAYSRDPFNTEQVEVSKGPASSYSGRGSTGGSINLVTKSPHEEPAYGGTFGLGTDEFIRSTVDVNQPITFIPHSAARLNLMWTEADQPGREVVHNSRWGIAPSLAFGIDQPTEVTVSFMHMQQNNIPDYGIPWVPVGNTNAVLASRINKAPPVSYKNFYGLVGYDYEHVETDVGTVQLQQKIGDSLTIRNLSRVGRTDRSSAITAPRFTDLDPGAGVVSDTTINRQLQRRDIENQIFANQLDATWKFETGPLAHALVGGVELTREDQDNRNSAQTAGQPLTDIFNPNPHDKPTGANMPANTGVPNDARADTVAVYAFETLKIGEHWELVGGVRYDHVESEFKSATNRLSRTDDMVSWRGAVVYKPVEKGSIYFGAGTSFNPSIDGNVGMALATNSVSLKPEETFTLEVGTKWELFKERLLATLALFRTEKTNARTPGVNPGDPVTVLDGEQIVQGVEVGFTGNITDNWQAFAGYTFMDTEVKESNTAIEEGAELSNAPKHSFSLWTTYRFPWGLELGGGTQYVGKRTNGTTTNIRTAPDYWLFDGLIAYHVNENVTLRLNVYNLADEKYIDRVGGGHFVPGAGRSAVLSASVQF